MTRKAYRKQRRKARAIACQMTSIEAARRKITARIMAAVTAFNGTITHAETRSN